MTREEAKDYIREWCPYDRQEEIIKVLEQEPCEDAISRQAVLDGIVIIAKVKAKSDAQKSLMGRVLFFTENLPSVTPQPKTDTDTLDKIRAEIDSAKIPKNQMSFFRDGINCALQIIDKYKAESEET